MEKDKKSVVPGDFLGTSEEFTQGKGVYDEEGNLYALQIGEIGINDKRGMDVLPLVETPPILKEGDVVIGRITDIRDTVAIVSIACMSMKGKEKREIAASTQGVIHISNVKKGYVSELQQEFGYLDVRGAKSVWSSPSISILTTLSFFSSIFIFLLSSSMLYSTTKPCPFHKPQIFFSHNLLYCPRYRRNFLIHANKRIPLA